MVNAGAHRQGRPAPVWRDRARTRSRAHWERTKARIRGILLPRANQLLQLASVQRLSERAIRLLSIQVQAELAFEDEEKARIWLRKPIGLLDGMTPLEAAQNEHGAEVVREMLTGLAWGAAA